MSRLNFLCIVQARIGSTRFPNKVMQMLNGKSILKHVWDAAKDSYADKVIVAWPERYPDLEETNVLERFRRVSHEFPSDHVIRLTSDCPMLTSRIINEAIREFNKSSRTYYCNRVKYPDGYDVQVFNTFMLHRSYATHKEHVIIPDLYETQEHYHSIDTKADLERVRQYAR